jgi:hypothetical protein
MTCKRITRRGAAWALALGTLGLGCAPPENADLASDLERGAEAAREGDPLPLSAGCGARTQSTSAIPTAASACRADSTADLRVTGALGDARTREAAADLADLGCVCEVVGSVYLTYPPINDLSGLSGLERAGGLVIMGGTAQRLSGLRADVAFDTIQLTAMAQLEALDGLEGLSRLDRLRLADLRLLADLGGLDAVEHIGALELRSLDRFDRFDGAPALRSIGALTLLDNGLLDDLRGLEAVESIDAIELQQGNLRDFSGLPDGIAVSSLVVRAETRLESLAPLTLAPMVTTLRLSGLRWLNDIGSLSGAAHIGLFSLDNLLELDEIDVLRGVSTMDSASVTITPYLTPDDYSWLRGVATHGSTPLEVW